MNRVSIIGFGRFGTMLHQLLIKGFEVDVFDIEPVSQSDINFVSLDDVLKNDTIFIAVPIRDFEGLMSSLSSKISGKKTIIDVCSVKVHPKQAMLDHLPNETDIIATHPLFGPDSLQERGSIMMMEKVRDTHDRYWLLQLFHEIHFVMEKTSQLVVVLSQDLEFVLLPTLLLFYLYFVAILFLTFQPFCLDLGQKVL